MALVSDEGSTKMKRAMRWGGGGFYQITQLFIIYEGEVVINMVDMRDLMVHFGEMMSGYENLKRKPIMLSGE